jgi:hypothetical protein
MIVQIHVLPTEAFDPLPIVTRNYSDGRVRLAERVTSVGRVGSRDAGSECQTHQCEIRDTAGRVVDSYVHVAASFTNSQEGAAAGKDATPIRLTFVLEVICAVGVRSAVEWRKGAPKVHASWDAADAGDVDSVVRGWGDPDAGLQRPIDEGDGTTWSTDRREWGQWKFLVGAEPVYSPDGAVAN